MDMDCGLFPHPRTDIVSSVFCEFFVFKRRIVAFDEFLGIIPKNKAKAVFHMIFPQPVENFISVEKSHEKMSKKAEKVILMGVFVDNSVRNVENFPETGAVENSKTTF